MAETKDPPLLFTQCLNTYQMMVKNKSNESYDGLPVYIGFLTKDMEEHLGYTTSQYSRIRRTLVAMGSIIQINRGAAQVPSRWAVITEPTMDAFITVKGPNYRSYNKTGKEDRQRVKELAHMINELKDSIEEGIIPALIEYRDSVIENSETQKKILLALEDLTNGKVDGGTGETGD